MIKLDYPSYDAEVDFVMSTTTDASIDIEPILSKEKILEYQQLVRKVPITDNVLEYAVGLTHKTRPDSERAPEITKEYLEWGAGPRASQFLVLGAKCHALLSGKYSPDIEDVRAVAPQILRHRIVKNFKAEANQLTEESIITDLL